MADGTVPLTQVNAYVVTQCPSCGSTDIRGPYDTPRSKGLLFTRAWFCRGCWWDREVKVFDDIEERRAKTEAAATRRPSDRR